MMFHQLFGDKPWYKSLTAWGIVLAAAAKSAETTGIIPSGSVDAVMDLANSLAGLLVVLGLRRAATAKDVG